MKRVITLIFCAFLTVFICLTLWSSCRDCGGDCSENTRLMCGEQCQQYCRVRSTEHSSHSHYSVYCQPEIEETQCSRCTCSVLLLHGVN